ncbi:cytochrome c oxidase assembly protein COX18, mitochondrial [Daktulosphaira vitifoliae]|uniref:cytochrome c oxidase assembly protein COX18, mitochondrial n=1 Tax=Daktulosphaira vitifoliae TaxID=58002 RepID=UPI0021AA7BCC|nr:cytochrome c oxidase assembly protein COX18, mitochondrial [Daktulosphaira vitifoliae]
MLCMRLNSFQLLNSTRYLSYYSAKCLTINPFLCDSINSNKRNISSVTYPSWFMTISDSTPVAYAQKYVVFIHEMTGTSWWASIIISAVSLRLALTLPLTIYQHRNNAKIENLSIEFQPTVKEIQKEVAKNVKLQKWPPNKAQRVYKKAIKKYWNELIIRDNCHPAKSSIVVWIQLPMWICLSIAIRNLTLMLPPSNEAVIRFTELTNGGILWFTNLTEIDSLMCLPLLMCISNLLIIQVQTYARNKELTRKQALTTNIFRGLTIFMLPLSYFLPSGVTLYWTTSSIYGLSQNLILLSPRLRKWFGIPRTPYNHEKPYQYIIDKTKQTLKVA